LGRDKIITVRNRPRIPPWLYRALNQVSGLAIIPTADNTVSIAISGGRQHTFAVLNMRTLGQEKAVEFLKNRQKISTQKRTAPLVAVRQLSSATRELLRKERVSWVEEETGVCFLVGPGLLIDTKIRDAAERQASGSGQAKLRGRSGLVAESVLSFFQQERLLVRTLTSRAGVSPGTVSRVLARLSRLNLLDVFDTGPNRFWQVKDAGALLDLWAQEERGPERITNLYVWSRSPHELLEKLSALNRPKEEWAIGGVAAANMYVPTLTSDVNPAIWLDARVPTQEIAASLGGEIVEKGFNLQVWQSADNVSLVHASETAQANWPLPKTMLNLRIVTPARAYIEAINGSGRAPEVARNLRERIFSS
jgi:hypothetical protein